MPWLLTQLRKRKIKIKGAGEREKTDIWNITGLSFPEFGHSIYSNCEKKFWR
jgi:hypothetical protein